MPHYWIKQNIKMKIDVDVKKTNYKKKWIGERNPSLMGMHRDWQYPSIESMPHDIIFNKWQNTNRLTIDNTFVWRGALNVMWWCSLSLCVLQTLLTHTHTLTHIFESIISQIEGVSEKWWHTERTEKMKRAREKNVGTNKRAQEKWIETNDWVVVALFNSEQNDNTRQESHYGVFIEVEIFGMRTKGTQQKRWKNEECAHDAHEKVSEIRKWTWISMSVCVYWKWNKWRDRKSIRKDESNESNRIAKIPTMMELCTHTKCAIRLANI